MRLLTSASVGICALFFSMFAWAENQASSCTKDEISVWLKANEKNVSKPIYPFSALLDGHQGSVVLVLSVDDNGEVWEIAVKKSSGYADLDAAAVSALKTSKFGSPMCGGKQSAMTIEAPFHFELRDQ